MQATWQLPLAMRKLQLRGGYTRCSDCRHLTAVLVGREGRGTEAGWVKWADRQRHLPSVCCVPRHVFKWHRLHFNSDIIHKCGTACRLQKRKAKVALPQEGCKGEGDRQRCTQNSQREREKEKNKTFGYNPPLAQAQLPSARFTSWNNWNNPRQGPRVKSRTHTHTYTNMKV